MDYPNQGQAQNQPQNRNQVENQQQNQNQNQSPYSNPYQQQNHTEGYNQYDRNPYQGYAPQTKPGDAQFYALLEKLQAVDFVLVELNLYLNTHPDDLQAIEQFNKLTQERTGIANEYQILYGPLQNFGRAYSKYPWEWNQTPWPWQV
ncbi:spore coat protein CotJB [Paenibacillus terrae]|uniref:spore coat protein CotJB n=1 Tax=Paenibacillus terrae TaxID=159743 RepID=UPI0011EADAE6|nr:spore coat protein CotJB [Paenibacillus terrae]